MAIIQSATGVQQEVDLTPKASRIIEYKADGTVAQPINTGEYLSRLEIIPTTLTAAVSYFSMRNLGALRIYITKLETKVGFSGVAAATRGIYEIARFTTATPSGGVAIAPTKKNTVMATSTCDVRFSPAGLTVAGIVVESPWHLIGHTNQVTIDHTQDIEFDSPFILNPNEGLVIRSNTALVLGSYLIGSIRWNER